MSSGYDNEEVSPMMADNTCGTDGALERVLGLGQKPLKCVPAIFIHAGAGFHSHQNEHVHLEACVAVVHRACEMGMKFLKAGATATEAVEVALRILEDKEITNAGYGSNLSIDGTVECDATIVDHLGRSGACGAVPNVRNPISLAKLILDTSNKPLSLRRVPPNALVGEGARNFAEEHGMATFANEYLVSKNSRDRFLRWQEDLKRAEVKSKETKAGSAPSQMDTSCAPCQYDTAAATDPQKVFPRDHTAAIMAGTWNEGQPDSPYVCTPNPDVSNVFEPPVYPATYARALASSPVSTPRPLPRPAPGALMHATPTSSTTSTSDISRNFSPNRLKRHSKNITQVSRGNGVSADATRDEAQPSPGSEVAHFDEARPRGEPLDEPFDELRGIPSELGEGQGQDGGATVISIRGLKRPLNTSNKGEDPSTQTAKRQFQPCSPKEDFVSDTIGAIAIDDRGHIAAGSSSGGIGMKHRGRLGPAALVGIGTAVVPCAEDDDDSLTVAAVTSGTGEHMATTMASQRCAERLYHGTRRGPAGMDVQDEDEDAIMESFIAKDFMDHPGVKNCHSAGAIGIMAVKKTRSGYYLYFAHNTDSFALASMGGLEKEPRCVMSRLPDGAKIAKGGRKVRLE
ncbi:asparaginase family [Trichoderma cornu-damae]|uniref:Asparaginase family n=1 Tax=Trichoderma cornu-damae TaxID=654480 RepID=A0A9P8QGY9_9HYPO|nr:asparaginase family [Trichoderma cornu-damae]